MNFKLWIISYSSLFKIYQWTSIIFTIKSKILTMAYDVWWSDSYMVLLSNSWITPVSHLAFSSTPHVQSQTSILKAFKWIPPSLHSVFSDYITMPTSRIFNTVLFGLITFATTWHQTFHLCIFFFFPSKNVSL